MNFTFDKIEKLDSICLRSDGDLTEYLDIVATDLINSHSGMFLEYLQIHPESCLKIRLVEGLASEYSVYERNERPNRILEERNRLLSIASSENYGVEKIKLLNEIFEKIDPNQFD